MSLQYWILHSLHVITFLYPLNKTMCMFCSFWMHDQRIPNEGMMYSNVARILFPASAQFIHCTWLSFGLSKLCRTLRIIGSLPHNWCHYNTDSILHSLHVITLLYPLNKTICMFSSFWIHDQWTPNEGMMYSNVVHMIRGSCFQILLCVPLYILLFYTWCHYNTALLTRQD